MRTTIIILTILIIQSFTSGNIPDSSSKNAGIDEYLNNITENLPERIYDFPADSFHFLSGVIQENENLTSILGKYEVSPLILEEIAEKSKTVYDVKNIQTGNKYTILKRKNQAEYFIYEIDPLNYIVFSLTDSVHINKKQKHISIKRRVASGTVEKSLWQSMKENHDDPLLAVELSDIFAWTFDVTDMKKGDKYKVLYEEKYIDGKYIGLGRIHAASYTRDGKRHYAILFENDTMSAYFDDMGRNLQRTYLKFPLRYRTISSPYTKKRLHPVLKIYRPHLGIDFAARRGTPVHAVADGVVERAYRSRSAGNMVKIRHDEENATGYLHLYCFADSIKEGTKVKKGQVVGYVGSTGLSTGPHLDFRFWKGNNLVNPLKVKAPELPPVPKEKLVDFEELKGKMIYALRER